MKFIDFFAGVGGFRRGMELAGHECVGFCEFDKFATASYTSMHLLTQEQREFLDKMPLKQRQKEILKEEYRNGEWYANDIRRVYAGDIDLQTKCNVGLIGAGDWLVERGWVLLHNPSRGIAFPTKNPVKEYTKAQKEFLYDYYMERDCKKEANAIWQEDE